MFRLTAVFIVIFLLANMAHAKRGPVPVVEPVFHNGIKYTGPNDDGRRAYVIAWDEKTNKKLWDVTVFENHIDPSPEEDMQWVFIEKLTVKNERLLVLAENGRTYRTVSGPKRRLF